MILLLIAPAQPGMGAEDFGSFSELAPGAMFSLSCKIEGDERENHKARYDVYNDCLPYGVAILGETALWYLSSGGEVVR